MIVSWSLDNRTMAWVHPPETLWWGPPGMMCNKVWELFHRQPPSTLCGGRGLWASPASPSPATMKLLIRLSSKPFWPLTLTKVSIFWAFRHLKKTVHGKVLILLGTFFVLEALSPIPHIYPQCLVSLVLQRGLNEEARCRGDSFRTFWHPEHRISWRDGMSCSLIWKPALWMKTVGTLCHTQKKVQRLHCFLAFTKWHIANLHTGWRKCIRA